jgi:menaquinone-9 beta-reductase
MTMSSITIQGGALAGAAAAIAAMQSGARAVCVYEKSSFPRHKVCGEFLSSGVQQVFEELGLWQDFQGLKPAPMRRLLLHFPRKTFRFTLPETCWGMSRYTLDEWLMEAALRAGATWRQEPAPLAEGSVVLAHGRRDAAPKGERQFGFKAHHAGPVSDAIELFFFEGCYVGVNPAENGITNVCGLGPENVLRQHGFDYDALCSRFAPLAERRSNLERSMRWLSVGPLVYGNRFREEPAEGVYPAGDALGFVDPFTGSGMLNALLSGSLAGRAAAAQQPVAAYLRDCKRLLHRPFLVSSLFRAALASGAGERLAGYVPGSLLFRMTRAHLGN